MGVSMMLPTEIVQLDGRRNVLRESGFCLPAGHLSLESRDEGFPKDSP